MIGENWMKESKVSIITFCHRDFRANYGQTLQAFALYKVVQELGYDVEVISHKNRTEAQKEYYYIRFLTPDKKTMESRSFAKITDFVEKNMKCLQSFNTAEVTKYVEDSDILICGSDSLWRTMHYDPVYYLQIEGCDDKLKIAYAPSFASYIETDLEIIKKMGKMIKQMDYISTREYQGVQLLNDICMCDNVTHVLDPTLLWGSEKWKSYLNDKSTLGSYMILYLLDDTNEYDLAIEAIRKKHNVEHIYTISAGTKIDNRNYFEEGVGLEDFISLIFGAQVVITNSFHGTAFSLMFEKEVYILKRYNKTLSNDFRFENIRKVCDLPNRMVSDISDIYEMQNVDYGSVREKIREEREKSMLYLTEALKGKS